MTPMKLRAWRKSEGLTLAELAERVETDVASLSRYERDERMPNQKIMQNIARETGGAVTANDFYGIEVATAEAVEGRAS